MSRPPLLLSLERNLSWFGKFGGTSPSDDSASILSTSTKPYRDLILANSISVFDFRIYVFARQCRMLGKMGRGDEVLKKGADFIRSFSRTLSENKVRTQVPELLTTEGGH